MSRQKFDITEVILNHPSSDGYDDFSSSDSSDDDVNKDCISYSNIFSLNL